MERAISRLAMVAVFLVGGAIAAQAQIRSKDDETPKPLPPLQKNFPLDQTWSLRELNGKPVPAGLDVSLKIDGALHGSGFAGCNSWSAVMYPVKDQHLAVGQYALDQEAVRQGHDGDREWLPVRACWARRPGTSSTAIS